LIILTVEAMAVMRIIMVLLALRVSM
jgi:hypothetical protein